MGTLMQHNGSVGTLEFIETVNAKNSKWALSSGEDGHIVLWRVHDWQPLLNISAHKESHTIHFSPLLAPHPSGKICLSIGTYHLFQFSFLIVLTRSVDNRIHE